MVGLGGGQCAKLTQQRKMDKGGFECYIMARETQYATDRHERKIVGAQSSGKLKLERNVYVRAE